MVVDMHAHVVVPGVGAEVSWGESGQVVDFEGRHVRSALREFSDLGRILEEQERAGVDHVVLSPWVQLLGREPERQNEALAGLVSDRVSCLGTVAIDRPDELVELMRDGRLCGVEVAASTGGEYLGAPRYRPFWAAVEETGALVFVHPTTRALDAEVFTEHYLSNTIGNPLETTITAAHMVLEGVLDDHPNLKVVLAHGGGAVTALRGRLQHHQDLRPGGRDVLAALRRFSYDTVVFDPGVLRALVDFVGAERVLLGSDYPFDMGEGQPAEVVRALELPGADEERILGGNALSLLGRAAGR
jgi:aminocarboxymuconate-semialdehyde decarboxylase